jgi:hypothetical protein
VRAVTFGNALLACVQSLLLAACAVSPRETPAPVTTAPASTTVPGSTPRYQPGIGIVESASVVALASSPSAAAGGTGAPASPTMAYRLKMADGSTQNVVHTGERFELGDRVQITSDGRLARP